MYVTSLFLKLTSLVLVLSVFSVLVISSSANALSSKGELCSGANLDISGDSTDCAPKDKDPATGINALIKNVVNILSIIVGVAAVIMIIYGGFRYITSGGDSGNITTAKNTIIYALVGLVIVALAQGIVRFVLSLLDKPAT